MRWTIATVGVGLALTVGAQAAQAYVAEVSPWEIQGAERVAQQGVATREREISEADAKKAAEERAPIEAQERQQRGEQQERQQQQEQRERESAALEAQQRQAQRDGSSAPDIAPEPTKCTVPALGGHSLARTRHMLRASHCSLGKVRVVRASDASLVVVRQSVRTGTKLRAGTAVAVTLAARRRRPHAT